MRVQKMNALKKIANYARSMGACTPRIIPQSAAVTRRMELLREELHPVKEKNSGNDRNSKKSFAQVLARMEKLEKSLKKASKRGKKRHCHEESDSNSDSS